MILDRIAKKLQMLDNISPELSHSITIELAPDGEPVWFIWGHYRTVLDETDDDVALCWNGVGLGELREYALSKKVEPTEVFAYLMIDVSQELDNE